MKKVLLTLLIFALVSCKKEQMIDTTQTNKPASTEINAIESADVDAKMGGIGFEKIAQSLGFETNIGKDYSNPNATKGGSFYDYLSNYPGVFRPYGQFSNTTDVDAILGKIYVAPLISYNIQTSKWERGLADYWKFSNNDKTLTLRINPNIKFSDGSPLTTEDIIATHKLITDENIGDPLDTQTFARYTLTKISDYILQVDVQSDEWKIWTDFNMKIMPKKYLEKIDAKEFVEKYAMDFLPSLGPYVYDKEKSKDQELIVLKRNPYYYGSLFEEYKNLYNFDTVYYKILRDAKIAQESFKAGEIDRFSGRSTDWWYLDDFMKSKTTFDPLKRNLIVKKVSFNGGIKRRNFIFLKSNNPKLTDIRVRKAISYGFDKDLVIEKILHNDAVKTYSITPLTQYESPNLDKYGFNPKESAKLLDEAGFGIMDGDGTRKNKDNLRLEFDMVLYKEPANELLHNIFQQNMKDIGIKINLQTIDFPNLTKKLDEKDYDGIIRIGLSADMYPSYETELLSKLAYENDNFNASCFEDKRADEIINQFIVEKDPQKRFELAHELDEIVAQSFNYIQLWVNPYSSKSMYWNKFGTAFDYFAEDPVRYWFIDKEKSELLEKAKTDQSIVMSEGDVMIDPFNLKPADYFVGDY